MQCIQEKRRGQKRAARAADNTLPPPKRGRPSNPTSVQGRLAGRMKVEKKLARLRRTLSFHQTPRRMAGGDDDDDVDGAMQRRDRGLFTGDLVNRTEESKLLWDC
jgi:hypothetical protein